MAIFSTLRFLNSMPDYIHDKARKEQSAVVNIDAGIKCTALADHETVGQFLRAPTDVLDRETTLRFGPLGVPTVFIGDEIPALLASGFDHEAARARTIAYLKEEVQYRLPWCIDIGVRRATDILRERGNVSDDERALIIAGNVCYQWLLDTEAPSYEDMKAFGIGSIGDLQTNSGLVNFTAGIAEWLSPNHRLVQDGLRRVQESPLLPSIRRHFDDDHEVLYMVAFNATLAMYFMMKGVLATKEHWGAQGYIDELHRYYIRPLLQWKRTRADWVVVTNNREVIIPAGTLVVANMRDAHRDPRVFEDPDVFRPGRANADKIYKLGYVDGQAKFGCAAAGMVDRLIGGIIWCLQTPPARRGPRVVNVTVKTGGQFLAGTDSTITARLEDLDAATTTITLDKCFHNDLERGSVHTYSTVAQFGKARRVLLKTDSTGVGEGWFCDWIEVDDCRVPVYQWLNKDRPELWVYMDKSMDELELYHRRLEYQGTTCHPALGDWGDTLPLSIRPVERDGTLYPVPSEVPAANPLQDFYHQAGILKGALGARLSTGKIETLNDYYRFCREAGAPPLEWDSDEEFGRQRVAGANPVSLKRVTSQTGLDDLLDVLGLDFDVEEAIAHGRLYTLDHAWFSDMAGEYLINDERTQYLRVPRSLFHAPVPDVLLPVAIEFDGHVYTSRSPGMDWTVAKMVLANADMHAHQFQVHALFCHFMAEEKLLHVARHVPSSHVIWKLLRPHFNGLASINNAARGTLVAREDAKSLVSMFGDTMSTGVTGSIGLAQRAYAHFDKVDWKMLLARNGTMAAPIAYPFRDDALVMEAAIARHVHEHVGPDIEVPAGFLEAIGVDRDGLGDWLIDTIFTASCFHAAVNFSQGKYMTHPLCMPGALHARPRPGMTEKEVVDMLPPPNQALLQIGFAQQLALKSNDVLGTGQEWLPGSRLAIYAQQADEIIAHRNGMRLVPYIWLRHENVPNSTAI
jgi:hypothetical protein